MKNNGWSLCKIDKTDWEKHIPRVRFANLLQSWEYGEAKRVEGWQAVRFRIVDSVMQDRGLLQVLVKKLPLIGGIARINRGPLLFSDMIEESLPQNEIEALWKGIRLEARRQRWWYLRIAPEHQVTGSVTDALGKSGLKKVGNSSCWGSYRVSLLPSPEELFAGLNGKWRNLLRKAQKHEVLVKEINDPREMEWTVGRYIKFQEEGGFRGIPENLLTAISKQTGMNWRFRVFWAMKDESAAEPVGFIVSVESGDTATYLIGWTSDEGRVLQANYILLWNAMLAARLRGLRWFDLGGKTENTPKGITHFKKGVGGREYRLAGEFSSKFF